MSWIKRSLNQDALHSLYLVHWYLRLWICLYHCVCGLNLDVRWKEQDWKKRKAFPFHSMFQLGVRFSLSFGYLHYRCKFAQQDQLDSTTKRTIMENEQMVRELSCCISTNLGLNILTCSVPFPIVWIHVVIYPFRVCQSRWLGYDVGYSWIVEYVPHLEHSLSSKIYEALVFYFEVRISDKREVW